MSEISLIIESVKTGNRKAQTQLYGLYAKAMFNICMRMMNDEDKAKDLLQEAFINVFTYIEKYNYEASIGTWIKRIVINKCIDTLRKEKKNIIEYSEVLIDNNSVELEESDDDITYTIGSIQKAIQELPEGYRVVFTLFAMEEYSHKQIAELLNISEGTSKSQYFKAKKMLKTKLNNG